MTRYVSSGTLNVAQLNSFCDPTRPADYKQNTDPTRLTRDDAKSWILKIQ